MKMWKVFIIVIVGFILVVSSSKVDKVEDIRPARFNKNLPTQSKGPKFFRGELIVGFAINPVQFSELC